MNRLFVTLIVLASTTHAWADKPNILFIYTDDQRYDALSVVQTEQGKAARFPWLKTPNLDKLASEGTRFRNAFVVHSLCSPSRAAFLSGRYGHQNGIVNNHTAFQDANVTHASLLRDHGYTTGYVGKYHMGSQRGKRPGFDFSASYVGQGVYFNCPIEVDGVVTPSKGWVDDVSTDYAIDFITANHAKPFALVLGYKSAHGPFEPPPRHADTYEGEKAKAVPNLGKPAIYASNEVKKNLKPVETELVSTNMKYFRCLTAVDENIGRLMSTLDKLGLTESTLVVYSSDNGFYLGEHGLGDKRTAYEESIRIPLLVKYPKIKNAPKTVDAMALNIDLAPTLLDFAGMSIPGTMQGRSWKPLLEGKSADWRTSFFYNYLYETPFAAPTVTAVRTESAKLVKYPGHPEWTEMFDLKADPYEIKNIANDPNAAKLRDRLEAEYDKQAKAIDWQIPSFADDPKKDAPVGDKPRAPLNKFVLDYRFKPADGSRIVDDSSNGNNGVPHGELPAAHGPDGGDARHFDGSAWIDVENSATLNPAVAGWTVTVQVQPEKLDGVILARGGANFGYALSLEEGRPVFQVISRQKASKVTGPKLMQGEWVTIDARIVPDKRLALKVNNDPVVYAPLVEFITTDPADIMQVGADKGSLVTGSAKPGFVGKISRVKVFSGIAP